MHRDKLYGFTLIELLIAIAISAVGISAHLGLQVDALAKINSQLERNRAIFIADDLASRMAVTNYTHTNYAQADLYQRELTTWQPKACIGIANYCTSAQMIEHNIYDIRRWAQQQLSAGKVYVAKQGQLYAIYVYWKDASLDKCQTDNATTGCLVLKVVI
jgi:prepilin-type N-terminal cleavage/methylation domain-containing protein